MDDKKVTE